MTPAPAIAARTLEIDRSHSEALFAVRHLITKVRGSFREFSGTVTLDEAAPERSSVQVTIQAGSIDTNEPKRDAHLRSADFFDAEHYPTLTFVSTGVTRRGPALFDVAGTLTIRGVAKAIVLPVSFLGVARDPWGNERAGFEAEMTINRKDFGLNWNAALETGGFLVGDEVKVSLSVQAVAAK